MNTQPTRKLARNVLRAEGMKLLSKSSFSDQDREYWGFGDGTDAFLDHTATITKIGKVFYTSTFTRKQVA